MIPAQAPAKAQDTTAAVLPGGLLALIAEIQAGNIGPLAEIRGVRNAFDLKPETGIYQCVEIGGLLILIRHQRCQLSSFSRNASISISAAVSHT